MANSSLLLRLEDLVNNPTARIPVCLCLDTSGSMSGSPIQELNNGVKVFYEAIRDDEVAKYSAEIAIVIFGGEASLIEDFANIDRQPSQIRLEADGGTPMGEAVNLALDCLERRKQEYKDKGVDYYQPWLVLMTDGEPNGSPSELSEAMSRTIQMESSRKLTVFPIGIGHSADMNVLQQFSSKRTPLRLQGLKFREFFTWLSQSVARTSQSTPGENVQLDVEGIKGWGEV